jgi:hypothetical protein
MVIAAECVQHCPLLKSYWGILSDPAHLLAEITIEVVSATLGFIIGFLPGRRIWNRWVARHDEQHHAGHTSTEGQ